MIIYVALYSDISIILRKVTYAREILNMGAVYSLLISFYYPLFKFYCTHWLR